MQDATLQILNAALKADATVTSDRRSKILKLARNGEAESVQNGNFHSTPRIYSINQAAEMLGGRTPRFVHLLCRKGLLKKLTAPGSQRSIGITSTSLEAFIAGN